MAGVGLQVAGVSGGVGTTTVATALGAADRGIFTGRRVDVLVCRSNAESLIRAGRAAQLLRLDNRKVILAVTSADQARPTRALMARLRLLEPNARGVVLLPYVARWRDLTVPLDTVRGLLTHRPAELPRPLRGYASAISELAKLAGGPAASPRPSAPISSTRTVSRGMERS